jgi:NADH dehydrogenase
MDGHLITVFGGTGFLGSCIVRQLATLGSRVRIAARHPKRPGWVTDPEAVELVTADIRDEQSVARAVAGADSVVNAVSLYVPSRRHGSFEEIHVHGAARVGRAARAAKVERLVLISGLGVDANSPSAYVRARMRGEDATRKVFPGAVAVRPSVLFGPDDAFLSSLMGIARLPVIPLFGRGDARLQPVLADDVARAVALLARGEGDNHRVFTLGGAEVYTYREIVELVLESLGRTRPLVPVPFAVWLALATLLKVLPNPPLTVDQVRLMQQDNVAAGNFGRFEHLGIEPESLAGFLKA